MTEKEKKEFTEAVHEIVRMIPYGRATSYSALAKASGYPNMSRMVGRIMSNSDSVNNDIPAYRVVNSQGVLSGKKHSAIPMKWNNSSKKKVSLSKTTVFKTGSRYSGIQWMK